MIRVRTGSRLHFGLFSLPAENAGPWLNQEGEPTIPRRQFGGVGLMIDKPGIDLTIEEAKTWSAEGPLAERALRFAKDFCAAHCSDRAFHLHVQSCPLEHIGLGTGTQLAVAVGHAISKSIGAVDIDIARTLGRGRRSAIGIHGFYYGGLIIDGGKAHESEIAPLLHVNVFPQEWRILLITPSGIQGSHGENELHAFQVLAKQGGDQSTDVLCRLVLLGMLPALVNEDLATFGEALYDFNRRSGSMFSGVQGGIYANQRIEEIIKFVRAAGVRGAGQSSWGPTIFAIGWQDELAFLRSQLVSDRGLSAEEIIICSGWRGLCPECQ